MKSQLLPFALAALAGVSNAATAEEWAQRSIYQVITDRYARSSDLGAECEIANYCGGTYAGIVERLDYIQNMGFTALQISPINENLNQTTMYGQAFHGYWPQNLLELNLNFGTADDLKNLSAELHARDMYLLVDVVANEMAYDIGDANMTSTTYIDYYDFVPFNDAKYYNAYCPITDWNNVTEYQNCWLGYEGVATPHLAIQDSEVASQLGTWIKNLVSEYDIDGIRLDGAKQMVYEFIAPFVEEAGVYSMGEVDDGLASFVCNYQNMTAGLENYPVYYTIIDAFTAGEMSELVSMVSQVREACTSPQYLATFIENQDNERFASYTDDIALAQNAIAFTILADGIPKMYYGQEQHLTGNYSPYNRQPLWPTNYDTTAPLYNLTATLNKIRNHAISLSSTYTTAMSSLLYSDGSTYAARKGADGSQIVSILSNQGTGGGAYTLSVGGAADEGVEMTELLTCKTVTAGSNGTIVVPMDAGVAHVYFPTKSLSGSGLCGTEASTTTSGASPTATKKSAAGHLTIPSLLLGFVGLFCFVLL